MDDLIPIIIFAVIGIAKLVSSLNEKNKPKKRPASSATEKEPSGLDAIFDELAQKMAPAPRKVADWPEHVQRPDYLAEMKMQRDRTRSAPPVPAAPEPLAPENPPVITPPAMPETAAMAVPFSAMSSNRTMTGLNCKPISMPPLLRSAAGRTEFALGNRKQLKKAILAGAVFGPPRAYEVSFKNTLAK